MTTILASHSLNAAALEAHVRIPLGAHRPALVDVRPERTAPTAAASSPKAAPKAAERK